MSRLGDRSNDQVQTVFDKASKAGATNVAVTASAGDSFKLVPVTYDYVSLGYTSGALTTVVFRSGGAAGTIKATLTLAYTAGALTSVTRS